MADPEFTHLRCRVQEGVLVVELCEKYMQGEELTDAIRLELFRALDHYQANRLVLDFTEVMYLGSSGFRPLLSLLRKLRETKGAVLFCNLGPDVLNVFHITRLVSPDPGAAGPFEVAPSLAEAVRRLS